jgi:DHA2 family multidrug resistance protein
VTPAALTSARADGSAGRLLVIGLVLAALAEAIAGTALSLGRADIIGDIHATPDEFAWLDVGYTAMKFTGFMVAPWLLGRGGARTTMLGATLVIGVACATAALTTSLGVLIALRSLQGLSGGVLLVAGQTLLFQLYPRARQPIIQALFAMGAVVAPATVAPALQGWLVDSQSWAWIFLSVAPLSLGAAGLMLLAGRGEGSVADRRPFDPAGLALISLSLICFTYVFSQGARWDWFEAPRIVWLATLGSAALIGFAGQQILIGGKGLFDFNAFRSDNFIFAFVVSFVAGAALFGSAWIIPSFAVSVLAFSPTDAGLLLLPSGAVFVAALLLAAYLMQARRLPPIATAPLGIVLTMVAMWMLSGSTHESGAGDMMAALLVRGLGLGFLFLSITLVAFGGLDRPALATGISLFNTGRQLGGLIGVAALQTMIGHHTAANQSALAAHVAAGVPAVSERLAATAGLLVAGGVDASAAGRAATALVGRAVAAQANVIAFETAFNSLALLFVFAAPVVIAIKVGLARSATARASRREAQGAAA